MEYLLNRRQTAPTSSALRVEGFQQTFDSRVHRYAERTSRLLAVYLGFLRRLRPLKGRCRRNTGCKREFIGKGSIKTCCEPMCVLIVDDEPLIRCLLCDEIAEAGYEVCQAENGDEAARLIQQRLAPFTLLITDVEMPGERNGLAVARLMRRRHPLIPVIYVSGRPDLLKSIGPVGENDITMAKPFQPSAIVQIACRLLGHRGRAAGL